MQVTHIGRFSLIFTAKRIATGWQGCARIKPEDAAPEPFATSPTYLTAKSYRSEASAEAAAYKEITSKMQNIAEETRRLDTLVAESGMRVSDESDEFDEALG